MRRLLAALALAIPLAAAPALASEKPGAPGTNVEMPFLIAPLAVDGRLYGYAYISLKVVTANQKAAMEVRERIAFVQDAFVRDVNARSVAPAADPKAVDKPALAARLLADARRVIGAAKIVNVQLLQIAISPIRPGEAMAARAPDEAPAAATPAA
ncbi:MAG TPA: hypothetical protein VGC36_06560, partial [Rhizomicrobium sp.]